MWMGKGRCGHHPKRSGKKMLYEESNKSNRKKNVTKKQITLGKTHRKKNGQPQTKSHHSVLSKSRYPLEKRNVLFC